MNVDFDGVEAFAEDTDDGTLADESIRVDHLNEAENVAAFTFASLQTHNLALLSGVPAVSVEDGHSVLGVSAKRVGYLLPFAGEDEKLH